MPETSTDAAPTDPTVRVTIRLPRRLRDQLTQAAREDDRDLSAQARVAFREHLRTRSDHDSTDD